MFGGPGLVPGANTSGGNTVPVKQVPAPYNTATGHMLGMGGPLPFPPELMTETNAWLAASPYTLVIVYAGVSPSNRAAGVFVIWRQSQLSGLGALRVVVVPDSYGVRIYDAPTGKRTKTRVGLEHVTIPFATHTGRRGTLSLATNSVSFTDDE
jgi:hypothetical protein